MRTMTIIPVVLTYILLGCKKENIMSDLKFSDESYGCSSFIVYKTNDKDDAAIAVIGDRHNLNLSSTEQTFNLGNVYESDLKIELIRFSKNANKYYCNDVPSEAGEIISIWKSTSGNAKIKITQDSLWLNQIGVYEYKINVIIQDVEFKNENGKRINVDCIEFKEVYVGWLPG